MVFYEEYHPYGTSAYRSAASGVEVSARRYRYTGKERDEETGLYYYGARNCACWLGRWTSADPSGIGADGPGLYSYTRGSPVTLTDPNGREGRRPRLMFGAWQGADALMSIGAGIRDLLGNSFQEIAEEKQAQVAKFQRESEAEVAAGTRNPIDAGVDRFLFGVVASFAYLPGTFYEYVADTRSSYNEGGVGEVLYDKAAAPKETLGRFAAAVGAGDVAESIREGLNFGLEIFGIAAGASQLKIKPGVPGSPSPAYAMAGGGSMPAGVTAAALPAVGGVTGAVAGVAMSSAVGSGAVGTGPRIALGLGGTPTLGKDLLENFAKDVDALTYMRWEMEGIAKWSNRTFEEYFFDAAKKAESIHFNLSGVDMSQAGALTDVSAGLKAQGTMTAAELIKIVDTPELLQKTTFYRDGAVVSQQQVLKELGR